MYSCLSVRSTQASSTDHKTSKYMKYQCNSYKNINLNASSSHGLPVSRALFCARSLSVSDAVAVQRKADVAVTQHHLLQMVRVCDVLFLLRLLGPTLWSRSTALFRWFVSAWSPCSCLGYGRLQQNMHGAGTLRQPSLRSCKGTLA